MVASNNKYNLDTSGVSNLFKTSYGTPSEATFNVSFPFMSQLMQEAAPFVGNQHQFPVQVYFSGSNAFGSLPDTNISKDVTVTLTSKFAYGRLRIDRRTMKQAVKDKGAWVQGSKEYVRRTVESFSRTMERAALGDGSLGTIATAGVTGTNPYTLTISAATWIEANWEEKDYINIGADTSQFEITDVDPDNLQITVTRNDGSYTPVAADVIYLQKSKSKEITGFTNVVDATSGTMYGPTVGRRWQAYHKNFTAGETISHEVLNEAVLEMERKNGKAPSRIEMSYTQYRKFKNQREDLKRFQLRPRDSKFRDLVSFRSVLFESDNGDIPISPNRFIAADRVHLYNDDDIKFFHAPDWGWFDDDGSVFMRMADDDAYEARYGGYPELFVNPAFQGRIDGLSI